MTLTRYRFRFDAVWAGMALIHMLSRSLAAAGLRSAFGGSVRVLRPLVLQRQLHRREISVAPVCMGRCVEWLPAHIALRTWDALSKGWIVALGGRVVRRGREWLQQRVACPCLPQASALDVYSLCTVSLCTPAGGAPRLPPARTRPMLRSSFLVLFLFPHAAAAATLSQALSLPLDGHMD